MYQCNFSAGGVFYLMKKHVKLENLQRTNRGFWGKILVPCNSLFQTVYSSLRVQLVHGAIRMVSSLFFLRGRHSKEPIKEVEREPETGIMRNQSLWCDLAVKNFEV